MAFCFVAWLFSSGTYPGFLIGYLANRLPKYGIPFSQGKA
jgi:hypothetical protein